MQDHWKAVRSGDASAVSTNDSTLLLRVIANSAARFPPAEAASLAADLLKVPPHPMLNILSFGVRDSLAEWCRLTTRR